MSQIDYFQAILLGVIQGLTEFLPISSSGHLALAQGWLGLDPDSTLMLLFDLVVHLGTLIAVAIVFAGPAWHYARRLLRESRPLWSGRRHAWRIALLAVAATIPTALIGLAFKDRIEAAFAKPVWIGASLIVTGCLLGPLAWLRRGRRGWKAFSVWEAVLIGLAQAAAILPGISRSGSTICIASYCGWRGRWAAQFSFLIAVPAIIGGAGLKLLDTFDLPRQQLEAVAWGPVIAGGVASLLVGVVALKLLLRAVQRAKLHYFAPYCWVVGVIVVIGAW